MRLNTLNKSERLSSKKLIKELFDKGSSFYLYPFKVYFLRQTPEEDHNQILFSVSKRNFKRAVDRNLLKRRMREAYRLNKQSLSDETSLLIAYIYTSKKILNYSEIEDKLKQTLNRLLDKDLSLEQNAKKK